MRERERERSFTCLALFFLSLPISNFFFIIWRFCFPFSHSISLFLLFSVCLWKRFSAVTFCWRWALYIILGGFSRFSIESHFNIQSIKREREMEGGKQTGSSLASDLFGAKDSSAAASSSSGIFSSMFPPPPKVKKDYFFFSICNSAFEFFCWLVNGPLHFHIFYEFSVEMRVLFALFVWAFNLMVCLVEGKDSILCCCIACLFPIFELLIEFLPFWYKHGIKRWRLELSWFKVSFLLKKEKESLLEQNKVKKTSCQCFT